MVDLARLSGDATLCRAGDEQVPVVVAVRLTTGQPGQHGGGWSGQAWPYRPLVLAPGTYRLRLGGEIVGDLTVETIRRERTGEVADFTGVGAPSHALRRRLRLATEPSPARPPRFPRVPADVELTLLGRTVRGLHRAVCLLLRNARVRRRRMRWHSGPRPRLCKLTTAHAMHMPDRRMGTPR